MSNFFILFIILGCNKAIIDIKSNEDYLIINDILKNREENRLKSLDLYFSNDNRYLVSVFEKLNDLENEKDKVKCDSIKADLGILNLQDSLIHKVFNENEYNHLISQKTYSTWKTKNIDNKKIKITKKLKNYIYISKPIYSKDKETGVTNFVLTKNYVS